MKERKKERKKRNERKKEKDRNTNSGMKQRIPDVRGTNSCSNKA